MDNSSANLDRATGFLLQDGVRLRLSDNGEVVISAAGVELRYAIPASVAPALRLLESGTAVTRAQLVEAVEYHDRAQASTTLDACVGELCRLSALARAVLCNGEVVAQLAPRSLGYQMRPLAGDVFGKNLILSRFVYMRRIESSLVLESPLAFGIIKLIDIRYTTALLTLVSPISAERLALTYPFLDIESLRALLALAISEGFIGYASGEHTAESDNTTPLRQWEFHDLLFHVRTRMGKHGEPVGATYRFRGVIPAKSAVKVATSAARIPLVRPDLKTVAIKDVTLTNALEGRSSTRTFGTRALTLNELGTFLFRAARVRNMVQFGEVELTSRPYPNGGASYEFEIYPLVVRCWDLQPGLYYYTPLEHALSPVVLPNPLTEQIVRDVWDATARNSVPDVILLITARFQRVSWKYQSIAYAIMLKNLGALYQTMYLVASAMNIGACAIGCGNSEVLKHLIAEDYYVESGIGEFMLGSKP